MSEPFDLTDRKLRTGRLGDHIATVIVILMACGVVLVFSASANIRQELELRRFYEFPALRQMLFFGIATAVIHFCRKLDYRVFCFSRGLFVSASTWLLAASMVLLAAVLIPGVGTEVNQARRWLRISAGPATVCTKPSPYTA